MTVNEWTWTDGTHTREIKSGSCQCWVFDTDPDGTDQSGRQCSNPKADGFPICQVHLGLFKRSRSPIHVEQFFHFDQGQIDTIQALIDGSQERLFAPGYFRKRRRIRQWLSEIEQIIEKFGEISLDELTVQFNTLYTTTFTTRQMSQGVKSVIDRGLVSRSRRNVSSQKIVFYEWIT